MSIRIRTTRIFITGTSIDTFMKNRVPRQAVIDATKAFHEPFAVEELGREAKKRHPGISRASIYRTLNKLIAEGAVRPVTLPNGSRVFLTAGMSANTLLYCETCHTVQLLPDEPLHNHITQVMKNLGFRSEATPICLTGRCEKGHATSLR